MLRLPAPLYGPLRLIGSGFGSEERLIAAEKLENLFFGRRLAGPPKPPGGADQA